KTQTTGSFSTSTSEFTGRENDAPATDFYFYRARYYGPTIQRFISEDPLEFASGANLYTYTHNDPINFVDPNGTCECSVRVRCRPVNDGRARIVSADHCYVVVKNRSGAYRTLSGGPDPNNSHILRAWDDPGDPAPNSGNSLTDRTIYYNAGGNSVCNTVDCLERETPLFDQLHLPYNPSGLNSNTFVSMITRKCAVPVWPPVNAPGWQ